jgi:hypothetical protein
MTQVRLKAIGGSQYRAGPDGQKVWVIYKQWPTGKVERVAAYFHEGLARSHAGTLVGMDGALIGLETIDVLDQAPEHPYSP